MAQQALRLEVLAPLAQRSAQNPERFRSHPMQRREILLPDTRKLIQMRVSGTR
jgi:hypothetical protein